jgi:hypothetical protein
MGANFRLELKEKSPVCPTPKHRSRTQVAYMGYGVRVGHEFGGFLDLREVFLLAKMPRTVFPAGQDFYFIVGCCVPFLVMKLLSDTVIPY